MQPQPRFLPTSREEEKRIGTDGFDVILVTGDAYVDHPAFGTALIGRVLWDAGFTVGIIAQPDWKSGTDFKKLGAPRLFFGISSGNVDSMVNNFTPNLKRRSDDVYSPGRIPRRPDRATTVYANKVHELFPQVPIVIGGIEASLRRFAHYDYWQDRVRQAILADAPADLLVFGMAELAIVEIARRLAAGEPASALHDIRGTTYRTDLASWRAMPREGIVELPSFTEIAGDKTAYARAFALHYREQDPVTGRVVAQPHPKTVVIQNPPARPLATEELDHIYELPFSRRAHPSCREPVPALEPVQFSIVSHRGCFGGCSFCALTHHQGRIIQSRSIPSLVREVTQLTTMKEFKGIVQDVGGPTANMYGMACSRWSATGACPDKRCSPVCKTLDVSHRRQCEMLAAIRAIPGVRKVFIGSGIRYDLVMADDSAYLPLICEHHVSGHLKVAPEHVTDRVTSLMNKPPREVFDAFRQTFAALQEKKEKKQYLLPYFMSGHPGCTVADMVELAEYIRTNHLYTEQVQDFTPTPMTVSTCMYYTGLDPFTMRPVHVPKGREKRIQRALMQYRDRKNRGLVEEGYRIAGKNVPASGGNRTFAPPRTPSQRSPDGKRRK